MISKHIRQVILNFYKKKHIYFITKKFDKTIKSQSDIILSPEFYWVKKINLNIKFSYEVKKMAPSIFDGVLPKGDFSYKVFKIAPKEFVVIAYDIKHIIEELKFLKIDISFVDKIYTIQSEFQNHDLFLKAEESLGIISQDGVIVCLPLRFLSEIPKINIDDAIQKKLSSNYIYSKNFKEIGINKKESNLISWFLFLSVLVLLTQVIKVEKERWTIKKQKERITKKYALPKTSFETKSIQAEFLKTDQNQNHLREALSYLRKFDLLTTEFFNSLRYEKSYLKFSIHLDSVKRERVIKNFISKKFKIIKTGKIGENYTFEVNL